jgi:hemoglobin
LSSAGSENFLMAARVAAWTPATALCDPHGVPRPSLFEFAGGEPAFLALAAAHHRRCLRDPQLNHPFSHPDQHPQHVERLAAYWAEVLGGPPRYSQSCGDQSGLLQMHAGNGDLTDLANRFLDCFVRAADDAGLPADAGFRTALRAYMRWALDEMLRYGPKQSRVPSGLAMPHWSWDGLQAPSQPAT